MEKKVLQVRLPAELHARLSAVKGSRSLNAEIVARLEESFAVQVDVPPLSPRAGWEAAVDALTGAPPAGPVTPTVYASERPRAGRRTMMCAHRVPVTAFCARCD